MKRVSLLSVVFVASLFLAGSVSGQRADRYTGTVIIFGSGLNTRTVSSTFEIRLTGITPESEAERYRAMLEEGGQSRLADELREKNLGGVQFGGRLGPTVVAAFERVRDGERMLTVVFERWLTFGELRAGARSLDYPFGVFEIVFESGKNEGGGTFIGAARIRLGKDEKTGAQEIELLGFGSFPGKLLGVKQVDRRLP